jgi:hypothetical protein
MKQNMGPGSLFILTFIFNICSISAIIPGDLIGTGENPRLIVTTDIGGDPDDIQSLTRLLLYSNVQV